MAAWDFSNSPTSDRVLPKVWSAIQKHRHEARSVISQGYRPGLNSLVGARHVQSTGPLRSGGPLNITPAREIRGACCSVLARVQPPGTSRASAGDTMRKAIILLSAVLLAGCATGMKGSPRRICYDAGLQPGTSTFTDCWHRVRDEQLSGDLSALVGMGLLIGAMSQPAPVAAPNPYQQPAQPSYVPPSYTFPSAPAGAMQPPMAMPKSMPLPEPVKPQSRAIMCADGSYVYGIRCQLAPNGRYVGVTQ